MRIGIPNMNDNGDRNNNKCVETYCTVASWMQCDVLVKLYFYINLNYPYELSSNANLFIFRTRLSIMSQGIYWNIWKIQSQKTF